MLDFEQIKKVSILEVLKRYGVTMKGRGSWHYAKCPLPTHESKEHGNSFAVNVPQNFWLCHSDSCRQNKGNKKGGDVINLVQVIEKCSMLQAAQKLADWHGLNGNKPEKQTARTHIESAPTSSISDCTELPKENKPLSFTGFKDLDPSHEYLRSRGVRITTAEEFGVGFFGGRSSVIKDPYRIVIPVHNASGFLVAYCGRATENIEPKYKFPPGFYKHLVLFNQHRVSKQAETIIIVEGFFSVFWLTQCGFPNVIALMGHSISDEQLQLLQWKKAVLMLDSWEGGDDVRTKTALRIASRCFMRSVELPQSKQPDDLSIQELNDLLGPLVK